MRHYFYFLVFALLMACSSDDGGRQILTVASERAYTCDGESGLWCPFLLVKTHPNGKWAWEYGINGFEYERGYEYVVEVEHTVVNDCNQYKLIRIISKERKTSAGLPERIWNERWTLDIPCDCELDLL